MQKKNYNKKPERILILISLVLLSLSCKKELLSVGKATVIQGVVYSLDEFSFPVDDRDSVVVTIKDTPFKAITDKNGFFKIEGDFIGKYTIIYEKKGYGLDSAFWEISGIEDTVDVSYHLLQFSNTVIANFSMELDENKFYAKGRITHRSPITNFSKFDYNTDRNLCPIIEVFCSKNSNVSREAYNNWQKGVSNDPVYYYYELGLISSGGEFKIWSMIPKPSNTGETLYYIAYGGSGLGPYGPNSKSNQPSNVYSYTRD